MRTRIYGIACLIGCLSGCATPGYDRYADAIAKQAEYRADVERERAKAIIALAQGGDATTRTVAVLMLAMQQGSTQSAQIEPPRDQALAWASLIVPSATALAGGYFGYRLGITQSNNSAATSIAGYGTMGSIAGAGFGAASSIAGAGLSALKPLPSAAIDWPSIIAAMQPAVTTTIGGDGVVGAGTISKPTTTTTTTTTNRTCTAGDGGTTGC